MSRQITEYASDDGQEIEDLAWSPDAKSMVYVRGGSSDNPEKIAPNPAHIPRAPSRMYGSFDSMAARRASSVKATRRPFSPSGDTVTWFQKGEIWYENPGDLGVKPAESVQSIQSIHSIHVFGDCTSFTWSPDGSSLAFVSDRGSHSFIGVYAFQSNTLSYVDPGSDHDRYPMWSPDSREIVFARIPYSKNENFDGPQRSGEPWSIRVADVATGEGREIWKASDGPGSVFREVVADHQAALERGWARHFPLGGRWMDTSLRNPLAGRNAQAANSRTANPRVANPRRL